MLKTRKEVPLDRLQDARHNPPDRIKATNIRTLKDSMETLGLLQPITIDLNDMIIEGHRRVAAARALGWKTIEANIVKAADADAIYGSVNTTSRKLSGSDALYVWLHNSKAVVLSQRRGFEEMEKVLGRKLCKAICDKGYSRRVFLTARRIACYCEAEDNETMQQIVAWLLKFPVIGQVMKAMEAGESPRTIMKAVQSDRAIKMRVSLA